MVVGDGEGRGMSPGIILRKLVSLKKVTCLLLLMYKIFLPFELFQKLNP